MKHSWENKSCFFFPSKKKKAMGNEEKQQSEVNPVTKSKA